MWTMDIINAVTKLGKEKGLSCVKKLTATYDGILIEDTAGNKYVYYPRLEEISTLKNWKEMIDK